MSILQKIDSLQKNHPSFSDVHVTEGYPLKFRDAAGLRPMDQEVIDSGDINAFLKHVDDRRDWKMGLEDGGGQVDFAWLKQSVAFRGNLCYFGGDRSRALVLRRLEAEPLPLAQLGLPIETRNFLSHRSGMLLVTGETGSGKTSTLASMVDYLNGTRPVKIITIEDPIEIRHRDKMASVIQRAVGKDADCDTFANALRGSLRQDPDVIMIGEIRDRETMETALRAAETGHLVLSTLHTRSAGATVQRIVDLYSGDEKTLVQGQVSSVLLGVISQTLLPSVDSTKRVLAYEIMRNTPAIANLIREGKYEQFQNTVTMEGSDPLLVMLNKTLSRLVTTGVLKRSTAMDASYDKKGLEMLIGAGR